MAIKGAVTRSGLKNIHGREAAFAGSIIDSGMFIIAHRSRIVGLRDTRSASWLFHGSVE